MMETPYPRGEIEELVEALCQGGMTPEQAGRLETLLRTDKSTRRYYIRYLHMHASLPLFSEGKAEGQESTRSRELAYPEGEEVELIAPAAQPEPLSPTLAPTQEKPLDGTSSDVAPVLGFLGDVFRAGASFLSQSFVLTLLVALGLPGLILTILFVSVARQPTPTAVAAITQSHRCVWGENSSDFAVGRDLFSGQEVQVERGFAEVTFADGATVLVEGPATFRPGGRGQGFLQAGRVVANVPKGAEGFTVATPSATIVDLGTEFGVEATRASGDVVVEVLKGKVEVGLVDHSTEPRQKRVFGQGEAVLARGGQYLAAPAVSFVRRCPSSDALEITPEYVAAVKQSGPVAYWRFETRAGDQTPNEMGPDNAGQLIGPVSLGGWDRNHTLSLPAIQADRYMVVDPVVGGPAGGDYSIEFWAQPKGKATPSEITDIDPAGMMFSARTRPRGNQDSGRIVTVQRSGLGTAVAPGRIRFLEHGFRYDFAKATYDNASGSTSSVGTRVGEWHHVVAVKNRRSLSLYVDGRCVGTRKDRTTLGTFAQIVVGQLMLDKDLATNPGMKAGGRRYFVGQLDELALYNRALSAEEISRHFELVKPNR